MNLDRSSRYYGRWVDSGAEDDNWRAGGIVKLLAFLRQETEAETEDYLRMMYGSAPASGAPDSLRPQTLQPVVKAPPPALDPSMLLKYRRYHPYLTKRGITEEVQQRMQTGYSATDQAVTIPWFDAGGRLATVMYRKVRGKAFWYHRGGRPTRDLVYGIDVIYRDQPREAVICEAPIDALTVMSAGHYAIAAGGTAFGRAKRDLIVRSPLESVVVMADHDAAGQAFKRRVVRELSPYMSVKIAGYPFSAKDINELAVKRSLEILSKYVERAKTVELTSRKRLAR